MSSKNLYEELFYKALRIRLAEEKIVELYPSDKIQSPVHLSIGQEAVAVGVCHSLKPTDLLFSTYRGHSFYLAKGGNLSAMMAELYGKVTGCCGGKGGSMHLAAPEVGFMGASAIVASTIPHAVGAAYAAKYLKFHQVIVSVFGDGATEEGVYHESLNIASLYHLPIIFLCENNGYAVYTKIDERQSYSILDHARSYKIPVAQIEEGYDFCKVEKVFSGMVDQVRRESRPFFVEINTFRYKEHVGPNEDFTRGYRDSNEFNEWKSKDPLIQDKTLVLKYEAIIKKEINDAIDFSEKSAFPTIDDLLIDVL